MTAASGDTAARDLFVGGPLAGPGGDGSAERSFASIGEAAAIAGPGDTVRVAPGIYRERVAPGKGGAAGNPVVYQAEIPGEVIVRGSEVWSPEWQPVDGQGGLYSAAFDLDLGGEPNPFRNELRRMPGMNCGQVFVEGGIYTQVVSEADAATGPGRWFYRAGDDRIFVNFGSLDPSEAEVEVSVRERIFAPRERGLGHVVVRGFVFEHAATQFPSGFWSPEENGYPQAGAVGTRSGHNWTIENNVIRHSNAIGLDIGTEGGRDPEGDQPKPEKKGGHTVRGNTISDNGAGGIAGFEAEFCLIEGNVIERNNALGFTAPETGGIKLHYCIGTRIERNLLRDNDCFGVWLDNVFRDARVSRNVFINNQGAALFIEMGEGPMIADNNVLALTRNGDGIYMHDASGVTLWHNLMVANSHFGVYFRTVTDREFETASGARKRVASDNNRIENNVFLDNWRGHISWPVPSEFGSGNTSDHNLFLNGSMWHWEGLGFHKFNLNLNDGKAAVPSDARKRAVSKALGTGLQNLAAWEETPYLDFDAWRAATSQDANSVAPAVHTGEIDNGAVEKGAFSFSARSATMRIRHGEIFRTLRVAVPEEIRTDLLGAPVPRTGALPGPLQNIPDGASSVTVWPLP